MEGHRYVIDDDDDDDEMDNANIDNYRGDTQL